MRLILISPDMLTDKTTGVVVVKILIPKFKFPFTIKMVIWCAISANRIIGPIFYEGTLDA
jgi:hypothetical protein